MLTPLDIESRNFSKTVSGYSVREVRQFMKDVLINYEKIYKENIELKDKINVLNEGIQYYKTIEETLQNTLLLAEKTAEERKSLAKQNADQIIREAELKAEVIIEEAKNEVYRINQKKDELIKSYDAAKIQIIQILKTQLELMEKGELTIHNNEIANIVENLTVKEGTNQSDTEVKEINEVYESGIEEAAITTENEYDNI